MNPSVLIVWFNPQKDKDNIIRNLKTYSVLFDKVYIVDNSTGNNVFLCEKFNNIIYLPLNENKGIAKALNIGCQKAYDDGFDWILTMDQDSSWDIEVLRQYIDFSKNIIETDDKIKSIAALPDTVHSVLYDIINKFKQKTEVEFCFCDRCICSGNFIDLCLWKQIGGFYEDLFIDEVDFDYCFRIRELGLQILQSNHYKFKHSIGSGKKTFLPGLDKHGSFRLYYMVRNRFYIMRKYPNFAKQYHYRLYMVIMFLQKCLFNKKFIENLKIYRNAIQDCNHLVYNQ